MNILRTLLIYFLWFLALVALLAVLAISPRVQTLGLRFALSGDSGLHGSVEDWSMRFGKLQADNLRLEKDGLVLTVPNLRAELPVGAALVSRKYEIGHLVAKGWKLDLSGQALPLGETTPADAGVVAREALAFLHEALSKGQLPFELTAEAVELEGDIVTAPHKGAAPVAIHVLVRGGPLAPGREGSFQVETRGRFARPGYALPFFSSQGLWTLRMDTPRTLESLGLKLRVFVRPEREIVGAEWNLEASVARGAGAENYQLDLVKGERKLVRLKAAVPASQGDIRGEWGLNLLNEDIEPFATKRFPKKLSLQGEGHFDTDAALARLHLSGALRGEATGLGVLAPELAWLETTGFDTSFDARRDAGKVQVSRFQLSLGAPKSVVNIKSLQPFLVDETTGALKASVAKEDWFELRFEDTPVSWFGGFLGRVSFGGAGKLRGHLRLHPTERGLSLQSVDTFEAKGLNLLHDDTLLASNFDLAGPLSAEKTELGWDIRLTPLALCRGAAKLATLEGSLVIPSAPDEPVTIKAGWKAEIPPLPASEKNSDSSWFQAKSAEGQVTATLGGNSKVQGKVRMAYAEAGRLLASDFSVELGTNGRFDFSLPLQLKTSSGASTLTFDGTWFSATPGKPVNLKISAADCSVEQLRAFLFPLAALRGGRMEGENPTLPCWGEWRGNFSFVFDRFKAWGQTLNDVRWTLGLEPGALNLLGASWKGADDSFQMWKGTLSFEPGLRDAYKLQATATLGQVEASKFFDKPAADKEPVFVGKFSIVDNLRGEGATIDDLLKRTREELLLESKGGIVRFLKTIVRESLGDTSSRSVDALASMGDAVGSFFGRQAGKGPGTKKLAKNTEAVLGFSYDMAEFRYEKVKIRATRSMDRTIDVEEFRMESPTLIVVGSGRLAAAGEASFQDQPLSGDLSFFVAGRAADYVEKGGLAAPGNKDEKGFVALQGPIHFGGTLRKLDKTDWQNLLAKAAEPKSDDKKKEEVKK